VTDGAAKSKLIWSLVVVLLVLHCDFWFWSDRSLVLGFMPVGLFYQALISVLAALAWAVVVKYAWPTWIEEWASGAETDDSGARGDDADG
jgi:hypothetical protein